MNRGFWGDLPRPFFALAPMYDVTDAAFRQIIAECGRPHVFFTEFVSADGLSSPGRERLLHHLKLARNESPIVAQIFGAHPDKFYESAKLIAELGFDGIDINMGCPKKAEMKGGACAALYKNPKLAQEIILAAKSGVRDSLATIPQNSQLRILRNKPINTQIKNIPVSVKIRIGDTNIDWQNWIAELLKAEPAAISIHLRTRKEMSKVPAHWEEMPKIVQYIHGLTSADTRPLIIGNGDTLTLEEGYDKINASGCDGIMLGRAIFQNPWLFAGLHEHRNNRTRKPHATDERLRLLSRHAKLFEENFSGIKSFEVFKRFIKIYVNNFDGAAELREKLYLASTAEEITRIADSTLSQNNKTGSKWSRWKGKFK